MECGILFHKKMELNDIMDVGFSHIEVRSGCESEASMNAAKGIVVSLLEDLSEIKRQLQQYRNLEYIVVETKGCNDLQKMEYFVDEIADTIKEYKLQVYVENGCIGSDETGYYHCVYSEVEMLRKIVCFGKQECGEDSFGICLNIGYANLLAQNIRGMIEDFREELCLVHMNDNNGFQNDKQMPYTFTIGRGNQTTDWKRIKGALWRIGYDKKVVFDAEGLFEKTPLMLQKQMMKMLYAILEDIESVFQIEELLGQKGKKLIMFGSGLMFYNYMASFGDKYPPEFIVDNDENRWGKEVLGILIKGPKDILAIPEEERNVFICNSYYDEIGMQLRNMGIKYHKYRDYFYNDSDLLIGG